MVTELPIVGGDLALDLANTAGDARATDPLVDYGDFVAWAARAGAIDEAAADRFDRLAAERPDEAARALERAREVRDAVDAVFRPLANGHEPPDPALAELASLGADAAGRGRLVASSPRARTVAATRDRGDERPATDGYGFVWEGDALELPLWPIAAAAVDLLRAGPLDRLKQCADCPWLFLDTSRNRSRRWCSMSVCGASSKMRRYRARLATEGR